MWFVVKILTFTSARWQTSFILDLTWHTDSCTSLLQRPPRSVDVASCTDPGQLKILHRSRASSLVWGPAPFALTGKGLVASAYSTRTTAQGFLRSNQIAETHGRIN